jgi:hypothetical protein
VTSTSSQRSARTSRIVEVMAVLVLGAATVGSAWCGYQATRWNGDETALGRDASDRRVEAAREFGLATQRVAYDSATAAQYAAALASDNERLQTFVRDSLVRPDFRPLLDDWEQIAAAGGTPPNLLEDADYLQDQLVSYDQLSAQAEALDLEATDAGAIADDYVLTTLLFAAALFFAGLTTSFRFRLARLLLLSGSIVLVAAAGARLADLPVA